MSRAVVEYIPPGHSEPVEVLTGEWLTADQVRRRFLPPRVGMTETEKQWRKVLYRQRDKEKQRVLRLEMIAAYGGCCACCNESTERFLTMDHKNNDGNENRKDDSTARNLPKYLKARGWPKDEFQLLCYNCNVGKYQNGGTCPHEDAKRW
jgi:hypothetical protein